MKFNIKRWHILPDIENTCGAIEDDIKDAPEAESVVHVEFAVKNPR